MSQFYCSLLVEVESGPPAVKTKAENCPQFQQNRPELAKDVFLTNRTRPEQQRGCSAAAVLLRMRAEETI